MDKKVFTFDFRGRKIVVESGQLAKQADGAVLVKYEDTTVLAAAVMILSTVPVFASEDGKLVESATDAALEITGDATVNAYNIAADANRDGVIDELDVDLVEEVGALSTTISQR